MARPVKKGLDYFPLDVDFFEKEEIKFLAVECGADGICALIKLYCNIFRNGYYAEWGEDYAALFCWDMRGMVAKERIDDIVGVCLKRGLFSRDLYDKYHVLTSVDVQEIYLRALDGKRQVAVVKEYWLLDIPCNDKYVVTSIDTEKNDINGEETTVNGEETQINGEKSTQRKGKENKGKKRKEFIPPSVSEVEKYFDEKGYSLGAAKKAFEYYDAGGWKDGKGNPVLNWKQKMISIWFKSENLKIERNEQREQQRINF